MTAVQSIDLRKIPSFANDGPPSLSWPKPEPVRWSSVVAAGAVMVGCAGAAGLGMVAIGHDPRLAPLAVAAGLWAAVVLSMGLAALAGRWLASLVMNAERIKESFVDAVMAVLIALVTAAIVLAALVATGGKLWTELMEGEPS